MDIVYGPHFKRAAKRLVREQKELLARQLIFLRKNPFDSRLHTKNLAGELSGLYSFRLGRGYRVIFQFLTEHTVQLIDVAHRKDIYR